MNNRLIKSNDAGGGGGCTNTVDLYNPFPDGGGIALYQLNGDATDVSGNYDGTATNVTYGAGEFGQAGIFNGSSSEITNSGTVNVDLDFSVSLWFNNQGAGTHNGQVLWNGKDRDNALDINYLQKTVSFYLYDGTLQNVNTSTFTSGWNNVVVTRSKTSGLKIYLNGSLQDTNSFTGNASALTATETIGNLGRAGIDRFFNGSIDQVRVFTRALRPYEVEALYTEEYCTPTIVPSEHFNTVTYTGNGGTNAITGVGFTPDLVWVKNRQSPPINTFNLLFDSVRGATKWLSSNATNAEGTIASSLTSFDSDGFSLGTDPVGGSEGWNINGNEHVSWNFKAGGAAVANTDGTITSQVSANTEAGFSVITTTTNGSGYLNCGHGLGVKPDVVLIKSRDNASTWYMYHKGTSGTPQDDAMQLNSTSAVWNAGTYGANKWALSDTVIASGTAQWYYQLNSSFVIYSFAEVEGFSSFGSYVGTNAPNNNIVTGFEPAMIIIKSTGATNGDWNIFDNKRNPSNPLTDVLKANTSGNETTEAALNISFLENGFSLNGATSSGGTGQINSSGITYIYMAFAADPTAVEPTLEDSFNTVTYTGNGGTQSVTGVGFQPDFTWIKNRSGSGWNAIFDAVRGVKNVIFTNDARAEELRNEALTLFNTDGFTVVDTFNGDGSVNGAPGGAYSGAAGTYVSWNWKGAEIPAINSNGSIPSVVSANPAAGFSIVSYTAPASGYFKVGHGLDVKPSMVITKVRNQVASWYSWHTGLTNETNSYVTLNNTSAENNPYTMWPYGFDTETFSHNVGYSAISNSTHIAYCFAEVAGFSKFGSYTGGTANNPINLGFEPAFVMIKSYSGVSEQWAMYDNKRSPTNPVNDIIYAQSNAAESVNNTNQEISFDANGFTLIDTNSLTNLSGSSYIYMAFANQF